LLWFSIILPWLLLLPVGGSIYAFERTSKTA